MILEEIVKKAISQGAQQAEVFWVNSRSTPVGFEANRLKEMQTRENTGVALRLVKNGRIGFSSTTNMDDIDGLVQRALAVAEFGASAYFILPSDIEFPNVQTHDPNVEKVSFKDMVDLGQQMIDKVRAANKELLCEASVSKSYSEQHIVNSNGGDAYYQHSSFNIALEGNLIRGTDMLFVGEHTSSCRPVTDTKAITDKVVEQLELARETVQSPHGKMQVMFTPSGVANTLLSPLLSGFNGKMVLQGASPLVNKLGQKILASNISIWDDPTVPYIPGSRPCDDEGIPSQRIDLVQEGVAKSFYYDLQTAGLAKTKTTASGERFLSSLPTPGTSVLLVREGDTPYRKAIEQMEDGLIVEQLLGAGQGNVLGGEFNGNVLLGFRVQNGKITGRVKDTMVSGNVYDVLKENVLISSESRWVHGSMRLPYILASGVSVSSKAE